MRIVAFLSLLFLVTCSSPKQEVAVVPTGFVKRSVTFKTWPAMQMPTGSITLHVPAKYDTLLTWIDESDTPMGHKAKYRFVSSRGCLLQESGFYKREGTYCRDTLDRLTISTQQSSSAEESLAAVDRRIRYWGEVSKLKGGAAPILKAKKLQVINGRTFSVVSFVGGSNLIAEPYEQVTATTVVQAGLRSWEVALHFECKQADCGRLAEQAYTTLQSVKIDTTTHHSKPTP
ncbi:hypothetical protein SAMN06265337_1528 [Hymenobacter gelipurpurascens]|uniref:Lipoprotein n=1 Tax=Hymenobacter gelipurpurascens TaxID=89968 RepID=A0A212TK32_9BACT|nr:hypothetical protein [Hymenobacter gelipurpurascens]SNC66191.1 hypothetical protein SAMN06265337_1528 [Hymenobacter gelipurpurascens]